MNLRGLARNLAKRLTGVRVSRVLPRGIDLARDIASVLPMYSADIVFDIGANVGQSAKAYLTTFPNSRIYCFEPVGNTFRQLQDNLKGDMRVVCHRLAFGSSRKRGEMVLQGSSDMHFLLGQSKEPLTSNEVQTESVDIATLDEFCHAEGIDRVSFLKIDTEGGDLDVLKGAESMLAEQRIGLIQVEAGMNPGNTRHAPFEFLKEFLESHGYFLFGIYEQVGEWLTSEPHLRRTNPVFISRDMIDKNKT